MKTVADRMKKAGHRFPSTMHVIASGIKKLQIIAEEGQGTWLFRGLGKNSLHLFFQKSLEMCKTSYVMLSRWLGRSAILVSQGFTKSAFMSMTGNMDVALEYSGVKDGKPATVFIDD